MEEPSALARTGPNLFKDDLISPRNAFLSVLLTFFEGNRESVHVPRGAEAAPRRELCHSSIPDLPLAKITGLRGKTAAERPKTRIFTPGTQHFRPQLCPHFCPLISGQECGQ